MNDSLLLELATNLGYYLAMSGAETYRVEESIVRVLGAYGYEAEAFAIPNCLTVSMISPDGTPMTRMRRIGIHGNDLDAVERYSNLSRRICADPPEPQVAMDWLRQTKANCLHFRWWGKACGYFFGAFGFCFFYGGDPADAVGSGLCGLLIFAIDLWMDRLRFHSVFPDDLFSFLLCDLGIHSPRLWSDPECRCCDYRRADAAGARSAVYQRHAGHYVRRHQLRHQPNRSSALDCCGHCAGNRLRPEPGPCFLAGSQWCRGRQPVPVDPEYGQLHRCCGICHLLQHPRSRRLALCFGQRFGMEHLSDHHPLHR